MYTKECNIFTRIFIIVLLLFLTGQPCVEAEIDFALIKKVEKDSLKYFLDYTPQKTGLTQDSSAPGSPCSIAGVGFYVAAVVVAAHNNWITKDNAYKRIKTVLTTFKKKVQGKNGFYYHFVDPRTGRRAWGSEVSSIDTALFIAGVLLAGEYFKGTQIERMAHELYENVQWKWLLSSSNLLSHGYKPESGILPYYWDSYSEHLILQALAIGSPTHPIPPSAWQEWNRFEEYVDGKRIIYTVPGPLFTYQFSHAFIDFRELYDLDINYFDNSIYATQANQNFCKRNAQHFKTYEDNYWGLTACLGPQGYKAYGAEPGNPIHDGTIAPYGAISSIVFTPNESFDALAHMYEKQKNRLYGPYGFKDAFNLDKNWYAREYLAIDQGITILMIENFRSQLIWKLFMNLEPIQKWIRLCGLRSKKT
ncbi:MAG: hypothetical protein KKH94_06830 [Candidatus Omnitrophica bacterium]|nr:hypothetical protein [Candidatus Omnitrophota bacterium]